MNAEVNAVLAIDPGREKWGLAVVEGSGACLYREVTAAGTAPARVNELLDQYSVSAVLLGDRTGSKTAREKIGEVPVSLTSVPEHRTTLLARRLYWRDHPPAGWRRLLPRSLQLPPAPLDAYAAEALALRYFGLLEEG